ncbi:MAG: Fe-S cluster assembly protein SufD [Alphaproteobacteria bacterium]|nr:Fe-S cluster assembly protein SufD [Alphaproteobacteria bacterium]
MQELLKNIVWLEDDNPVLFAWHQKGRAAFKEFPTKKTEAYKYTPVSEALTPEMLNVKSHVKDDHCDHGAHHLPFDAYEFCFCDGHLHRHFHAGDNIEVLPIDEAVKTNEIGAYFAKIDLAQYPFAALNTAFLKEGLFIRIHKTPQKPIVFLYHNKNGGFKNIRNVIVADKGVKAEWVEVFEGKNEAYFLNIVNEIFVLNEAKLTHHKLQHEGEKAVHIALSDAHVKEGGQYQSYTFEKGGKLVRNETHVMLNQENALARVNAAYHLLGNCHIDTTTNVEHLSENTRSDQMVRGVIDDKGHGVFQGKIHIAPDAQKTEGYQIHKALLLSDEAKVDVKPELEIFADDVKCSHGATSGDLNQDEIFYLESRGIDETSARQVLINAFLQAAFDGVENQDIKKLYPSD